MKTEVIDRPLEWAALWDAMRPEPHAWIPTTEHMYYEMLGAVPPTDMGGSGFLMGEANHHNAASEPVYAAFVEVGNEYQARYMTQREFSIWKAVRK